MNNGPLDDVPGNGLVTKVAGAPSGCAGRLRECSRLEWRIDDVGDPAALLEDFLASHGLPTSDLAAPASLLAHDQQTVCGASVLITAAAAAKLAGVSAALATPAPAVPDLVAVVWAHATPPGPPGAILTPASHRDSPLATHWQLGTWQPSWSRQQHATAVTQVQQAIGRGDVYQVNVVGHSAAAYAGDPTGALARVTQLPGARYAGTLSGAGWAVSCASPETLVQVANGRVLTGPIKGTRPATAAGRVALLASTKERAEHVMIVDLARNDLARVAQTGSVCVDDLFAVRRWCDLWQAESQISAQLADGVGLAALLRAVLPGGSVTGAPKLAALQQVAACEAVGRGPSMGALGWVGHGTQLDLGLTIRTTAVDATTVHLWAGGGITWDSEPMAEVDEAEAKAAPVRAAIAGPAAEAGG